MEMAEWNFLSSVGVDPQLVTAGSAGGLVRALMRRQKALDAIAGVIVGAIVSNYFGGPASAFLSGIEVSGVKINLQPAVGGFFVGLFAFAIIDIIGFMLRDKFGQGAPK